MERGENIRPGPTSEGGALRTECKPSQCYVIAYSSTSTLNTFEALNLCVVSHPGLCLGCFFCLQCSSFSFRGYFLSVPQKLAQTSSLSGSLFLRPEAPPVRPPLQR